MFDKKAENMTNGFIIQREIRKARRGEDFFFNDPETLKPVRCQGLKWEDFLFYYRIWENWYYLKILPHGKGWLHERPWVLELIKIFIKIHKEIKGE